VPDLTIAAISWQTRPRTTTQCVGKPLPNSLPCFRCITRIGLYLTKTGKSFDGQGVPPDIRVPVYPKVDLESGRDGALEKVLEVLGKR
jgi:hypothetical protein